MLSLFSLCLCMNGEVNLDEINRQLFVRFAFTDKLLLEIDDLNILIYHS
jgi:hypothetical protein